MKLNRLKYAIVAAALFFVTVVAVQPVVANSFAQNPNSESVLIPLNQSKERAPFTDTQAPPPSYAGPPGSGDGQKLLPVPGGLWIVIGLTIVYGIACRKRRKREGF